jgi:hypothetical protein
MKTSINLLCSYSIQNLQADLEIRRYNFPPSLMASNRMALTLPDCEHEGRTRRKKTLGESSLFFLLTTGFRIALCDDWSAVSLATKHKAIKQQNRAERE